MISPILNGTKSGIGFLCVMTKVKSSTHLANKRTFGGHSKVVGNGMNAKLKLGNLAAEASKDSAYYH